MNALRRFFQSFHKPWLVLGVLAVMGALYGMDQFLASLEQRELGAQARHLADTGRDLMQQGRKAEAIEAFRRAHALERDNRFYELSLADALISDGNPESAVETLDDLLDEDSNDGPANLLMARAAAEQQRFNDANSYYHRAIYGAWPAGEAQSKPLQARLELVRLLAKRSEQKSLLGELIPLEEAAKSDPSIEQQLPALFLQAGSLTQAEGAYRALIKEQPDAPEPYAGLGRVEMEKGNFYSAHLEFEDAVRRGDSAEERSEAEMSRTALDLDPTPRRLAGAEKLVRSNKILAMAEAQVKPCATTDPVLLASADKLLAEKAPKVATNEMAEMRLDLAEKLWRARCKAGNDADARALAALMKKIAQ